MKYFQELLSGRSRSFAGLAERDSALPLLLFPPWIEMRTSLVFLRYAPNPIYVIEHVYPCVGMHYDPPVKDLPSFFVP